jgi:hypothetical protein
MYKTECSTTSELFQLIFTINMAALAVRLSDVHISKFGHQAAEIKNSAFY